MRFPTGAGFPVGVGMRLLSLLDQLAALEAGVVSLEFETPSGLYGYLDRNGFFRYLDNRIVTTPARPSVSGAERYEGNSQGLVEVAELSPGLAKHDNAGNAMPRTTIKVKARYAASPTPFENDEVLAAATGAFADAAFVLGRRALMDLPTVLIACTTLALLFLPKRIPEPALVLAAGITGILLNGAALVGAH